MAFCPAGTITFLFSDIQESTQLWERHPEAMKSNLERHDRLLRDALESHGGRVFKTMGDAFLAAFSTAPGALAAALAAQRALQAEPWEKPAPLRVRMALHTGAVVERDGDYFGPPLNRISRLLAIGHGGQVLLSQAAFELARDELPDATILRDLGEHRLADLSRAERIFQLVHPDLQGEFPHLKSLEYLPSNLPTQLTRFIGREQEGADAQRILEQSRLLTLTGPGGVGKTRLALQIGADLLDRFADGVWVVELAALGEPSLVAHTAAATLGLREEASRPILATLLDYLQHKSLLLVLDNCEHLVEASAQLAEALLKACAGVKALATGREPLRVAGEMTYPVGPLSFPDVRGDRALESLTQYEAVQLFIDRALAIRPDFVVTGDNAPAVAEICHRLDGIPLALELAVAWVKTLSPEQIAARLDDRFRLLTGGSRGALPRQKTLRATIDWSYALLPENERALLRRLSVFAGGWTLESVEEIADCEVDAADSGAGISRSASPIPRLEVLGLLAQLVDKSLVAVEQEGGGNTRYRLLETIRHYSHDRLLEADEAEWAQHRHLELCLRLAQEVAQHYPDPAQAARLEREHDNLRAALDTCVNTRNAEAGLHMAAALWRFWELRGHISEARQRLANVLALECAPEHAAARANVLEGAGLLASMQSEYETGRCLLEESLALRREVGDRALIAASLMSLGQVARAEGNRASARALLEEGMAIYRELGDRAGIAASLVHLGRVAHEQDDYGTARCLYEQSLAIERQLGNQTGVALALNRLGLTVYGQGDYAAAHRLFAESLAIRRELGDRAGVSASRSNLGLVLREQGDCETARRFFAESLADERELGSRRGTVILLNNLADAARCLGDYEQARSLLAEGIPIARQSGYRASLAEALYHLGKMAYDQHDIAQARSFLRESLTIQQELENRSGMADALEPIALLAAAEELPDSSRETQAEMAARLLGAAQALREAIGAPLPPSRRPNVELAVAGARAVLGEDRFNSLLQEGRAMPLEKAVSSALEGEHPAGAREH